MFPNYVCCFLTDWGESTLRGKDGEQCVHLSVCMLPVCTFLLYIHVFTDSYTLKLLSGCSVGGGGRLSAFSWTPQRELLTYQILFLLCVGFSPTTSMTHACVSALRRLLVVCICMSLCAFVCLSTSLHPETQCQSKHKQWYLLSFI